MKWVWAMSVMLLLGTALFLDGTAYAGEKFVLRASLYRTKVEAVDVGDAEGHRLRMGDAVGIAFNAAGGGFLDAAEYVVKTIADEGKTGGITMGYKIFTTQDGSKAFARFEGKRQTAGGPAEGTFQFTGGTGKFQGLKGSGTWWAVGVGPGLTYDRMEGEYELPR